MAICIPLSAAAASPPSSLLDSRIPRPSPSALRRAASLRLRGERPPPPHYTRTSASSAALVGGHQYHHRRHNHFLQSSQQHQHPDHRTFPVITENGTDSPRQRSLVSNYYLFMPFAPRFLLPDNLGYFETQRVVNFAFTEVLCQFSKYQYYVLFVRLDNNTLTLAILQIILWTNCDLFAVKRN